MVDFAKLRKGNSLQRLTKTLENQNKKFTRDERYWQPVVDKAGNGFAMFRFMMAPAIDGEDADSYVSYWSHSFKGPTNKWYIERSLTSLNQNDPVSEFNSALWDTGVEANQNRARDQKRKLNYVSNILILKHPARPEDEGKIFLYNYGTKIMDKIKAKLGMQDKEGAAAYDDPDDVKFDPFNFWEGANFKLKIKNVKNFRNYDDSEFVMPPSALFGGDDKKIEEVWQKLYSLKEVVAPSQYKTYDELKKKLDFVLGTSSGPVASRANANNAAPDDDIPTEQESQQELNEAIAGTGEDDSEAYAAFAKLAEG